MGFFDTVKDKAGALAADTQRAGKVTAAQARLVVLQNDLRKAERELGHAAFALAERGELDHPDLAHAVERLRATSSEVRAKEGEISALRGETPEPAAPVAAAPAQPGAAPAATTVETAAGPVTVTSPRRQRRETEAIEDAADEAAAAEAPAKKPAARKPAAKPATKAAARKPAAKKAAPRKTAGQEDTCRAQGRAARDSPQPEQGRRHSQEVDAASVFRAASRRQEPPRRHLNRPAPSADPLRRPAIVAAQRKPLLGRTASGPSGTLTGTKETP